jgi:flagellin
MSVINEGKGVQAASAFRANTLAHQTAMERLATGQRINRAKDDPAGLISSEQLREVIAVLEAESRSSERADYVAQTADSALGEISEQLIEARGLAVANANSAGLSDAEREANQMAIDAAVQSVERIARTTTFNGRPLLDGSFTIPDSAGEGFTLEAVSPSTLGIIDEATGAVEMRLSDIRTGGEVVRDDVTVGEVLDAAISQVNSARGRLGAYQAGTIQSKIRNLNAAIINTIEAESRIRDSDYAAETAALARADTLKHSSLTMISAMSDAYRQMVLGLMGG